MQLLQKNLSLLPGVRYPERPSYRCRQVQVPSYRLDAVLELQKEPLRKTGETRLHELHFNAAYLTLPRHFAAARRETVAKQVLLLTAELRCFPCPIIPLRW